MPTELPPVGSVWLDEGGTLVRVFESMDPEMVRVGILWDSGSHSGESWYPSEWRDFAAHARRIDKEADRADLTAAEFVEVMETVPREFWPEGWGKVEYAPETPDRIEGIDVWPTDNMPWPTRFTVDVAVAVAGWAIEKGLDEWERAEGGRTWIVTTQGDGYGWDIVAEINRPCRGTEPTRFRALAAAARAVGGVA